MTVRLRDVATLLEPATKTDTYTEAETPDWTKPPARELEVPFKGDPLSSTEESVTAETIISRWRAHLPPSIPDPADLEGLTILVLEDLVTPAWRIRWHGEVYLIDSEIAVHRTRQCTRYLSALLKKVS